jgi:ribosomal protein L16 Arg81 hydroxylase
VIGVLPPGDALGRFAKSCLVRTTSRAARGEDSIFYLICEKDSLLTQMAGTGRLLMKYSSVLWESMQPGDFVYIPAGTPHRYVPTTESLQTRYKAEPAGLEGVAWFWREMIAQIDKTRARYQ